MQVLHPDVDADDDEHVTHTEPGLGRRVGDDVPAGAAREQQRAAAFERPDVSHGRPCERRAHVHLDVDEPELVVAFVHHHVEEVDDVGRLGERRDAVAPDALRIMIDTLGMFPVGSTVRLNNKKEAKFDFDIELNVT